jgi:hypothetical protein
MKRVSLCVTLAATAGILSAAATPAVAQREGGAGGERAIRFKGTIKAIDARTGRFIVPVSRGRDGDPAPTTVEVLVHTARATRFLLPPIEGAPQAAARFQDLTPGLQVNVSGIVRRDGSVAAQEVTLLRRAGGAEGEGGRRSPEAEAGPRRSPEAEAGPRRSPEAEAGPRRSPEAGRRDGAPRDGEGRRGAGPRDGERPRTGPRDGERPGAGREDGRPGAEQGEAGWLPGRVRAIDAQRGTFLMEWRIAEGGTLRTVRGTVTAGAGTRFSHGAPRREGEAGAPATFRDLQVGGIVHVRASEGPDGLYAAEIRVMPTANNRRPAAGREGDGRRSPESGRER